MAGENGSKINQLLRAWPHGTVATLPWLESQGVSQQLAFEYEKGAWLAHVGRGVYIRSGDKVDWTGGLYAMQSQLKLAVHVGGKTALEMRGLAHFIPTAHGAYVYLFGSPGQRLPAWFIRHKWRHRISYKMPNLFGSQADLGLTAHLVGSFEIRISSPERAVLEMLYLVPEAQDMEESALIMEAQGTLRPKLVQTLLEKCKSIKAKRLFLFLAERSNHAWLKKIDLNRIDLGVGKRSVVSGGYLDAKYQITVPRALFPKSTGDTK